MCGRITCLLVLILGLVGSAAAQDYDMEIPSVLKPPVLDGEVDPIWSIARTQYIKTTIDGTVSSPADCSGSWRAMWDGLYIYVIVDVNDDSLQNNSGSAYLDDSVEFYFDGGNTKGPGSPLSGDDRQYTFGWTADDVQGTNTSLDGVEHSQVNTDTGWRIEMRLPWLSLQGSAPAMGDLIGIDVFINDDDDGGDSREAQGSTFSGSNADWQIPASWGTAILVKGSGEKASAPNPADGDTDVSREVVLEWTPGEFANTHDVYFGTVFDDVSNASRANLLGVLLSQGQSAATFDPPGRLEFDQPYYWRIDEVNAPPDNSIHKGDVWTFTAESFAYPVQNIIATTNATSEEDSPIENTINGSGLNAQDQHSIAARDMWLATPPVGEATWIQYEFPRVEKLYQMLVWNYNVQFELILGFGLKDVAIEYSENGADWTALGAFEFARATAKATYAANTTVDFGGVAARFVRLTINSGYGLMGQYGLSEVRFLQIPVYAQKPQPADGATDVDPGVVLRWQTGREAVSHEVYLGSDEQSLALAGTAAQPSLAPTGLEFGGAYFWKVVEVNEAEAISVWEGDLWSFATKEYAVIDGFETYTDNVDAGEAIFDTWVDGWVNSTGSTVGYLNAPFAEKTIVNSGRQSMPLQYDNSASPWYSETERDFETAQDWTAYGATTLAIYFRGNAPAFIETAQGIVMSAIGTDIWDTADQFRFAYKSLSGNGSIIARVDTLERSNEWAKAGVMIRETLEPGSKHAFVAVTPDHGISFQRRPVAGQASANTDAAGLAAPYWVKLTRTNNTFTAQHSADGTSWADITVSPALEIQMAGNVYIGLALTSHDGAIPTSAEFSSISTTGSVSGQWQVAGIGVTQPEGNAPEALYVAVEDAAGKIAVAKNPDPAATTKTGWNQWQIPYSDLAGVNLGRVAKLYIGVGDRNAPAAGGAGTVYIDDIGYGRPVATE